MSAPVVTVTVNPCVDKICAVDQVIPERKLEARDVRQYPGGGGINVARVVARLGGEPLALWSAGGPTGELLGDLLAQEGVPEARIPIRGWTRENLIVNEYSSGQQYRFGMPGPELSEAERARWQEHVRDLSPPPRYLVLSGSLPRGVPSGFYAELIHSLSGGARVVVDTKKDALRHVLAVGTYLIKPNVHELEEVVGRELDGDHELERAAREVVARGGAEIVVVSLGRAGALLVTERECERIASPAVRPRSKVGAGDSMVGGIVTALAQGRAVADAVRLGVAAGAAAVMTEGTELCRREDVEQLYALMTAEREAAAATTAA